MGYIVDAMSQTWSYTGSHIRVLMHVPDMSYTSTTLSRCMSQTRLTLAISIKADACLRHVLHWHSSLCRCHVPDMVLHWLS
ncbi:1,4-dihydroxy-2-naphthoyl-CoA hydrolase [Gossypium arboreum]|uniref:1,4-dihydroxy-2-naphthoyl-CoA hydrolase n=1 Tax=Gossypium arboreum TaxID=29729 RepID=A0A0B0PBB4_GOSAR|nr:1,4-dihydroxy-2-naphthoyl-CoA hydrolase [Gossypium arboreum]